MESSNSGSSSPSAGTQRTSRQDVDQTSHIVDETGADFLRAESFGRSDQSDDACIGGIHQHPDEDHDFQSHRPSRIEGDFSDLITEALKDAEVFVRRYPWPTLLVGFAVGYLLSRSRER